MTEGSYASRLAPLAKHRTHIRSVGAKGVKGVREGRWISRDAVLIVDIGGKIADCSPAAAELLGREADELNGHSVKSLISGLPFGPNTPGYNLAYAGFHGAADLWLRRSAQAGDGSVMPVDVALANTTISDNRYIVLTLRPTVAAFQRAA